MTWSDSEATREFGWLSLMSRLKYDGYQDYLAGARFIESLADWVQQFPAEDRTAAYAFVRHCLVYIGPSEMLRLVELLYSSEVQRTLVKAVAAETGTPPYYIWASKDARTRYEELLRRTLFIGLRDGAPLNVVHQANSGVIGNDLIAVANLVDYVMW